MRRVLATALVAFAAISAATRAEAIPVVYIDPSSQIAEVGDAVSFDVWIKDLTESIGAFDIDIVGDPTVLDGVGFTLDPDNNFDPDTGGLLAGGFFANGVNLAESGDPVGNNAALAAFRLARVDLTAVGLGLSPLTFDFVNLSNALGTDLVDFNIQNGSVCVVQDRTAPLPAYCTAQAPEPGLIALLGAGLAGALYRRRQGASRG